MANIYWQNFNADNNMNDITNWSFDMGGSSPCSASDQMVDYVLSFAGSSDSATSTTTLYCGGIDLSFVNPSVTFDYDVYISPTYGTGLLKLGSYVSWSSSMSLYFGYTGTIEGSGDCPPIVQTGGGQITVDGDVTISGTNSALTISAAPMAPSFSINSGRTLTVEQGNYAYLSGATSGPDVTGDGTLKINYTGGFAGVTYPDTAGPGTVHLILGTSVTGTFTLPSSLPVGLASILVEAKNSGSDATLQVGYDIAVGITMEGEVVLETTADVSITNLSKVELLGSSGTNASLDCTGDNATISTRYFTVDKRTGTADAVFGSSSTIEATNFNVLTTTWQGAPPIELNNDGGEPNAQHTFNTDINVGDVHAEYPSGEWILTSNAECDNFTMDEGALRITGELTVNEDFSYNSPSAVLGSPATLGKLTVTGLAEVTTPVIVRNLDCRDGSVLRCQKAGAYAPKHEEPVINSDLPRFASA
jgi:hypothetical protein